jgi:uroporphyrinogen III methyltransferase/synthase
MTERTARRILVTRGAEDCALWAAALRERGVEAVELPCITTERLEDAGAREALADALSRADWLVFTSRRGVEATAALAKRQGGRACRARIAAVGPSTGEAARGHFGRIDFVAHGGTARSLAEELVARLRGQSPARLALLLAENAPNVLERRLEAAGHACWRLNVYRTTAVPRTEPKRAYSSLAADAVFLASPSAVLGFVNQVELDIDAEIYTIGPTTTAAAKELGLSVAGQAREPSLEGLLEATKCLN